METGNLILYFESVISPQGRRYLYHTWNKY